MIIFVREKGRVLGSLEGEMRGQEVGCGVEWVRGLGRGARCEVRRRVEG